VLDGHSPHHRDGDFRRALEKMQNLLDVCKDLAVLDLEDYDADDMVPIIGSKANERNTPRNIRTLETTHIR
jgi:hypothetical protein